MSRVERHKKRREGSITGVGKSKDIENAFDINPITRNIGDKNIKRQKSHDPIVSKDLNMEEIKAKVSGNKRELFDIDEAFGRLQIKNRTTDQDTQLQIMSRLFKNNVTEYSTNKKGFMKENESESSNISEEELLKLLEEREKVYNVELAKKRKIEKNKVEIKKEDTGPYTKDNFEIEGYVEVKKNDSIKSRIIESEEKVDDYKKKANRNNVLLVIILFVLIIVLVLLVYSFISRGK